MSVPLSLVTSRQIACKPKFDTCELRCENNTDGNLLISDFPSLSGAPPQSQAQNPGHLVWANASQRAMQQTPVQRQQHPASQAPSRAPQTQTHLPQPQSQNTHDDVFPSGAQFANRLDDFRNGGQGISGQLGAGAQPQTGNIDEFPPLGRNVPAELGQDRRGSLMQNAGFGNYASGMSFPGANQGQPAQNRSMISSVNGPERMMSPATPGAAGKFHYLGAKPIGTFIDHLCRYRNVPITC